MKVNLGCGPLYLEGWVNVDSSPDVRADVYQDAIEFIRQHGGEFSEVYMGHLLEHLVFEDALNLLLLIASRSPQGTLVSAVTPDMRAVFEAYIRGEIDNQFLNAHFIYSYVQPSHHAWCHDSASLVALFSRAGIVDAQPIDVSTWDPVFYKTGENSRWQCGVRGNVPVRGRNPSESYDFILTASTPSPDPGSNVPGSLPTTTEAEILRELHRARLSLDRARTELSQLRSRGGAGLAAGAQRDLVVSQLADTQRTLDLIAGSRSYRVARRASRLAAAVLPPGSRQRRLAGRAARRAFRFARHFRDRGAAPSEPHDPVVATTLRSAGELDRERVLAGVQFDPQRFRVVVLPGEPTLLSRTLASLDLQTWGHWESWRFRSGEPVLDQRFPNQGESDDPRHHIVTGPLIPATVNVTVLAHGLATPDLVLLVREGDILAPECLYELASFTHRDPLVDVLIWDDDVVSEDGLVSDPRIRPNWSPDVLLSGAYPGRALAIRHGRLVVCGGFAEDLPFEPEYLMWDALLRSGIEGDRAGRVPRILSHVAARGDCAGEVGREIVQGELVRRGITAMAVADHHAVRLICTDKRPASVTVVIPTRSNFQLLEPLLDGLRETDHPDLQVVVIDNGGRSSEKDVWYQAHSRRLDLNVEWWDRPFNYSAVNNLGAKRARGEVLAFLNDDIEILDSRWLRQLCGWAMMSEIGAVGMQLVGPEDLIQHGGVIVGLNGFADHLFQGMRTYSNSLIGPTAWYRNVLAVTGACLAIRRETFDLVGGFDERMALCGSDVSLCLEAHLRGLRTICLPDNMLKHHESATRGSSAIPQDDFHASYWKYQPWLHGGDPYWSPALSLSSRIPRQRQEGEPSALDVVSPVLGRTFATWHAGEDLRFAAYMAQTCRASVEDTEDVRALHRDNREQFRVRSINWVLPGIDSPFYGGINTALRLADYLARRHEVDNRFVVLGSGPEPFIRAGIAAAFPRLGDTQIHVVDRARIETAPPADLAVATLWTTAFDMLRAPVARRKFYLVQDYEPMFYPAGSMYALAEMSYRLGYYGLCNTDNLADIYRGYGGVGLPFTPAIDPSVFHARGRLERSPDAPATVFVYARPNHYRNCWELALPALVELKERLGDRVRIVAAGSWAIPEPPGHLPTIDYRGMLEYRSTGRLYRECDIGLALTVSEHPSYLPLELMACGAAVVAFDNPAGHWLLRNDQNCLLTERTVDCLTDALERVAVNPGLRRRLRQQALHDIAAHNSDWDAAFSMVYEYFCDPERVGGRGDALLGSTRRVSAANERPRTAPGQHIGHG